MKMMYTGYDFGVGANGSCAPMKEIISFISGDQ